MPTSVVDDERTLRAAAAAQVSAPDIAAGAVHVFYLFDVAQAIDLDGLRRLLGPVAAPALLADRSGGPAGVHYFLPPVVVDGGQVELPAIDGFSVRLKCYDYGVLSLMLSRPFAGSWTELARVGQDLIESDPLEQRAGQACQRLLDRIRPALVGPRTSLLTEDYVALVVHRLSRPCPSDELVSDHGAEIAQLLRGEQQALSRQEQDEVLRHRMSYLPEDLVVLTYNAALVVDTEAAAASVLEILELVNSQLLEFRYYDELLDSELSGIYTALQQPGWRERFIGRRSTRAARRLHALFIEVNELNDRMGNAVKLVGDVYSVRLAGLAGARLGLDAWKRNVQDKLQTLDAIYRFAVEQTGISQGNLLELVIVLILVLELGLLLSGLMR